MNTYQAFQLGGGYEGPFPFAAQSMPPGAGGVTSVDDLRTVFVTGFPSDVRDRELHNLLRFLPGYEACQMSSKSGSAQGFALFANSTFARQAMEYITNMEFDHEMRLRCELAHKNMYLKDDPSIRRASGKTPFNTGHASVAAHGTQGPVYTPAAATALQVATGYGPAAGAGNSYNHIGLSNLSLRPVGAGNLHPYAAAATMAAAMTAAATQSALASSLASAAASTGVPAVGGTKYDNPPCNTLFIGNLGDSVDEAELLDVFNRQPGFRQLKLVRNPRQVSGFVEFADVPSASLAHSSLQAATLTSSNRGPIRIQYSKNPFGRRSGDTSQQQGYSPMHPGMAGINASADLNWPPSYTSLG